MSMLNPIQGGGFQAGAQSGVQSLFQQTMNAAAKVLNMSTQTLMGDLGSGQSLAQIAQSQGMSTADLVNGIVSQIQSSGNAPANLTQTVTNMVNATPGHHHHHHPAAQSSTSSTSSTTITNGQTNSTTDPMLAFIQDALAAASQTLNTGPQSLLGSLASGQSLAQLGQAQGLQPSDLVNAIVGALEGSAGTNGSQLTQFVTNLVNAVPGQQSLFSAQG